MYLMQSAKVRDGYERKNATMGGLHTHTLHARFVAMNANSKH